MAKIIPNEKLRNKSANPDKETNKKEEATDNQLGMTPEQRKEMIKAFNKNMEGFAHLEEEEPDEQYKLDCKKAFEDEVKLVRETKFKIAGKERALEVAKFLKEYNEKFVYWERMAWRGVIMFNEVINKEIESQEKEASDLELDYGALTFLYSSMMNPNGRGLESAKMMEILETVPEGQEENEEAVTYSAILEKLGKHVDWLKAEDKKINILQQVWASAESGLKMKLEVNELEDFIRFAEKLQSMNS